MKTEIRYQSNRILKGGTNVRRKEKQTTIKRMVNLTIE
jgi:hypothetical protein